jgi:hypothetical protein
MHRDAPFGVVIGDVKIVHRPWTTGNFRLHLFHFYWSAPPVGCREKAQITISLLRLLCLFAANPLALLHCPEQYSLAAKKRKKHKKKTMASRRDSQTKGVSSPPLLRIDAKFKCRQTTNKTNFPFVSFVPSRGYSAGFVSRPGKIQISREKAQKTQEKNGCKPTGFTHEGSVSSPHFLRSPCETQTATARRRLQISFLCLLRLLAAIPLALAYWPEKFRLAAKKRKKRKKRR